MTELNTQSNLIRVAGIVNDSITDGPGLRLTLFTQGCLRRCKGCHNSQTHDLGGGKLMSVQEILHKIKSNPLLTGVTISGGEPMLQAEALIPLVREVKKMGLEVAVYTGNKYEDLIKGGDKAQLELLSLIDTLVDGEYIEELRSLDIGFRGSANQRFIDARASLKEGKVVLDESGRWCPKK